MPRQARLDAPGTLHHVMVRGIERRRIVDDGKDRGTFMARLGEAAASTGMGIYNRGRIIGAETTYGVGRRWPLRSCSMNQALMGSSLRRIALQALCLFRH